jgi:hypothetical protein
VTADGVDTDVPCHLVVSPPGQRVDAAVRTAVTLLARERTPSAAGVGIAVGGLGHVEAVTASFSVARGSQSRSAARGGEPTIGWIDADALFATFAKDADENAVKGAVRELFDQAMTRALESPA